MTVHEHQGAAVLLIIVAMQAELVEVASRNSKLLQVDRLQQVRTHLFVIACQTAVVQLTD